MEHTITANGIRQGRPGGLVLSQLQIGLAAGCAIVACLTAFGGGVIVGMWYKASEHIAPLSATLASPAAEQPLAGPDAARPPAAEQPVTFYNTLTGNQAAYTPLTPQPTPPPAPGATRLAAPAPDGVAASPGITSSARPASAAPAKTTAASASSAARADASTAAARTTAAPEAPKAAQAVPPQKRAEAAPVARVPKGAAVTAATPKPTPRERRPEAASPATPGADYSVQVGSFGSSEQAERLRTTLAQKGYPVRVQLSEIPGQGLRYRVRVGSYADRASADQSAHHLTAQEQVPAIVAGKN